MSFHSQASLGARHAVHNFEFADIAARDAYTPVTADVGRVAKVGTGASADWYILSDEVGPVWEQIDGGGAATPPDSDIAEATGDASGSNTSDTLVPGMTLTPPAGTYLVWFTGSVETTPGNTMAFMSIYSGGSQVGSSEREYRRPAGQSTQSFCCVAKVTVNGAEAIEGRARVDAGTTTGTIHERSLAIVEVS